MNHEKNTEVTKELVNTVRQFVGPVASFKDAFIVRRLPKTRSGKIARGTIAAMLSGKPYKVLCVT
jgi:propionyl-CoA synthetase